MGEHPRKLGLLAGTFEDGSLSVYVVPDPEDVSNKDDDPMRPTFGESLALLYGHTTETGS
jgi:transcription factor C subunit 6